MAITVYGVDSLFELTHFAEVERAQSLCSPAPHGILQGFVASIATGDRRVSVSTNGIAYAPGVRIVSDSAYAVTLDANNTSSPRIDYVVLEVDWSGDATSAGKVKFEKGGTSAPTLTQDPGSLWQIPLARVTVDPDATSIAGKLTRVAPVADTGYVTLSVPAGWEQQGVPLAVCRANGIVECNGRIRRTGGNVTEANGSDMGDIIPEGFRPRRQITIPGSVRWGTASAESVSLGVDQFGRVVLYPEGSTFNTGDVARFHATWLPEV